MSPVMSRAPDSLALSDRAFTGAEGGPWGENHVRLGQSAVTMSRDGWTSSRPFRIRLLGERQFAPSS